MSPAIPRVTPALLTLAVSLTACVGPPIPQQGTFDLTSERRIGPIPRTVRLHVPESHAPHGPRPLLVVLHGAFSSGERLARQSGFDELADREGFLVAYPNGLGLFGKWRHWNSGHCCGPARRFGLDDVAFVDSVIDDVSERWSVDPARVYLVGHSNGGMLAHRYAAERSDRVAAVAVVGATIGGSPSHFEPDWQIPEPAAPVPILMVHGRHDARMLYGGGPDPKGLMGRSWLPVEDSAGFWAEHNGCQPVRDRVRTLGGAVERAVWRGCERSSVALYTLEGWGHAWPGPGLTRRLASGLLRDYDGTAAIWDFLRRHRRPPVTLTARTGAEVTP